jgi:glycosyltransferase involved in cell wall biosynthesis
VTTAIQQWRSTAPFHHGSHRDLLSPASPPEVSGDRVDAIIVPSARSAPYLRHVAGVASELACPLVVLCSRRARARDVINDIGERYPLVDLVAVDVPAEMGHPMPRFETSRQLAGTKLERRTDTSLKRNLGLLLAKAVGWQRVVFLDDDIVVEDPADLRRAVALLDKHYAVGLSIGGYPDNSVVCHAHREAGGRQDTFVGGGALAVRVDRIESFFPKVYNEDWLFLLDDVRLRPVAQIGMAYQQPYDPFADPERARGEEFGDDLAEGVFALLDNGKRVQDADERYWRGFLADRATLILDIIDRTAKLADEDVDAGQRRRMLASLKAAYGRLKTVMPEQFVSYLRAWRADNTRWRRCLAELPTGLSADGALRHLGLAGHQYRVRLTGFRQRDEVPHEQVPAYVTG